MIPLRIEEDGDDYDCGLMPDGQCLKAGSEECDWECPNRLSEGFCDSPAWCRKHGVHPAANKTEIPTPAPEDE